MSGPSRHRLAFYAELLAIAADGGETITVTVPVSAAARFVVGRLTAFGADGRDVRGGRPLVSDRRLSRLPPRPRSPDVLNDSEFDLFVELDDLRAEIATREDRIRVVLELLARVRDSMSQRGAEGLP